MPREVIKLKNVWFKYSNSNSWILKEVNLSVDEKDFFLLTGPPACGKSTLCLTLNGLIPHNIEGYFRGDVIVFGRNTRNHPVWELAQYVGMVFQDPESQFIGITVLDDLLIGLENLGIPEDEAYRRIEWALKVTRLKGLEEKSPFELSGGQKQRVAIAAALTLMPKIIVLDEPLAPLDPIGKKEVIEVLHELNKKYGITIFITTYEVEEVIEYATKMAYMENGTIKYLGTPDEVINQLKEYELYNMFPPQCAEITLKLKNNGINLPKVTYSLYDTEKMLREVLLSEKK